MIRGGLQPLRVAGHWRRATLACLLAAGACAAHAQGEPAVMKRGAELREAPGDAGRSLAALPADAPVTRLGERQGPWIRVRNAQGTAGWVHLFDVGPASNANSGDSGGLGGALRGVTHLFNRGSERRVTTATSTIGIRGLGAEDLAQAQPDPAAVARMETLRQTETQARQFGRDAALVPAQVEPLPAPPRAAAADTQPGLTP